jgi:hypothetical protein
VLKIVGPRLAISGHSPLTYVLTPVVVNRTGVSRTPVNAELVVIWNIASTRSTVACTLGVTRVNLPSLGSFELFAAWHLPGLGAPATLNGTTVP